MNKLMMMMMIDDDDITGTSKISKFFIKDELCIIIKLFFNVSGSEPQYICKLYSNKKEIVMLSAIVIENG